MSYSERCLRLLEFFKTHGYSQVEGEYFFRTKTLDTLKEMFGLTSQE